MNCPQGCWCEPTFYTVATILPHVKGPVGVAMDMQVIALQHSLIKVIVIIRPDTATIGGLIT